MSKSPVPAVHQSDHPPRAQEPSEPAGDEGGSHYEAHREQITAAFLQCSGNLSATERLLRGQGIRCTRRWIGIFASKWGLR